MSRWILAAVLLLVIAGIGGYGYFAMRPADPPAPNGRDLRGPAAPTRETVAALGRIRPAGGIVNVGGTTGMRVAEILVTSGDRVTAGQPLARMQDFPLREQELIVARRALEDGRARLAAESTYAEAAVEQARIALEQSHLQEGEIATQEQRLQLLRSNVRLAENNLRRVEGVGDRVVSPQEREQLQLSLEQARDAVQEGESRLEQLRATQRLAVKNAEAQLEAAQANLGRVQATVAVESLAAQVELAEQALYMSTIRSPIDGTVLEVLVRPGEVIGQQPIAQLGNTELMEVVAEVYETDIGLVQSGQRAMIHSPALSQSLEGTVTRVSPMVAINQILGLDPAARADVRVVPVTIRIDQPQAASRLVNLQVDVTIDLGNGPNQTRASTAQPRPDASLARRSVY